MKSLVEELQEELTKLDGSSSNGNEVELKTSSEKLNNSTTNLAPPLQSQSQSQSQQQQPQLPPPSDAEQLKMITGMSIELCEKALAINAGKLELAANWLFENAYLYPPSGLSSPMKKQPSSISIGIPQPQIQITPITITSMIPQQQPIQSIQSIQPIQTIQPIQPIPQQQNQQQLVAQIISSPGKQEEEIKSSGKQEIQPQQQSHSQSTSPTNEEKKKKKKNKNK